MATDFVLSRGFADERHKHGMSLSAWLEANDPTSKYGANEHTDAFQRQLINLDIRTVSDHNSGMVAHGFDRWFDNSDGLGEQRKLLVSEWMNRTYKAAANVTGTRLFDSQAPLSYTVYPPTVLPDLRFLQIQPTALPYMIARIRTISTETFMALYLQDSAATGEARMARVEEYAEIPTVSFDTSVNQIRVKKYGRRLEISYEQMRRMNNDMVAWSIQYIAARAARDKEDAALDVLINGDGNLLTSATSNNGSTYDSAAAGKLTLKMWIAWRLQAFTRPYVMNTIVANPADIANIYMLAAATANIAAATLLQSSQPVSTSVTPVRTTLDGVRLIDNANVPVGTILGFDNSASLEYVVEAGADIVETDRVITAQYQNIVLTETNGFAIATLNQNQALVTTA